MAVLMGGGFLLISSCATAPTASLAPGEVRLLRIEIPHEVHIQRGMPFTLNIIFEADGKPEIKSACFYWTGEGPKCFKVVDVIYGSPGKITVEPHGMAQGSHIRNICSVYSRREDPLT
jgi:hypothetical protein